ncbi:MAG TPA: hypothetical protein V6D33_07135 [Cyanophyceae cyanobacterium]
MIYTASYFQPQNWHGMPVAISLSPPKQFSRLPREKRFIPDWSFVNPFKTACKEFHAGSRSTEQVSQAWDDYSSQFLDLLMSRYDSIARWIEAQPLERDITLLCYEKPEDPLPYCHRNDVGGLIESRRAELFGGFDVPVTSKISPKMSNIQRLLLDARAKGHPVWMTQKYEGFFQIYNGAEDMGEDMGFWTENGAKGQLARLINSSSKVGRGSSR